MEYAGAKRPVLYYHKQQKKELTPDKFSIGGLENNNSVFSKQTINLNYGDRIIMFTDGVTDQFDSKNKIKITRKRFEYQLSLLTGKPLNSVKKELLDFLKHWRGCNSQTDDILVLGIEIS